MGSMWVFQLRGNGVNEWLKLRNVEAMSGVGCEGSLV